MCSGLEWELNDSKKYKHFCIAADLQPLDELHLDGVHPGLHIVNLGYL